MQSFLSKKGENTLWRSGHVFDAQLLCFNLITTIATEVEKVRKLITDYAISHFHFSNLKRSLVIKVKYRAEISLWKPEISVSN